MKKNKLLCAGSCQELAKYQRYLLLTEDKYSPPAIDYEDDGRNAIIAADDDLSSDGINSLNEDFE